MVSSLTVALSLQIEGKADVLLDHISKAGEIFSPVDPRVVELHHVVPVYTGCFDLEIENIGKVRLEVDLNTPNMFGDYEVVFSQWIRHSEEAFPPLELFNIRVQG